MRVGLIGCGAVGTLRAQAVAGMRDAQLVAVADADGSRARHVAGRSAAVVAPDWRALIRRDDVDAVIVSTPPPLHAEMTIAALESGKHVLCEKPLARTPAEGRAMVAAAERAGRVLATGFNYRFYPAILRAREIVESGLIGDLDHIRSFAGHPGGREFTHPWVHDPAVMGGGALLDNGIHVIDLTRYFLGEVSAVAGYATGHVWGFSGCEDNGFALLRSPTGRIATLQASWTEWRGYRFSIDVYGTRGCVRASYPPMLVRAVALDGERRVARRRAEVFPVFQMLERLRSHRWTGTQSMRRELTAFAQTIAGDKTELALGRDGLRAVEIAHAIYRASRDGGVVALEG